MSVAARDGSPPVYGLQCGSFEGIGAVRLDLDGAHWRD